jgi:hypothetical protein
MICLVSPTFDEVEAVTQVGYMELPVLLQY